MVLFSKIQYYRYLMLKKIKRNCNFDSDFDDDFDHDNDESVVLTEAVVKHAEPTIPSKVSSMLLRGFCRSGNNIKSS